MSTLGNYVLPVDRRVFVSPLADRTGPPPQPVGHRVTQVARWPRRLPRDEEVRVRRRRPWANVHTLRTTHITEHIARRTDIKTVQGNAGRACLATTNFYARYVKEAQIRAMQENAL